MFIGNVSVHTFLYSRLKNRFHNCKGFQLKVQMALCSKALKICSFRAIRFARDPCQPCEGRSCQKSPTHIALFPVPCQKVYRNQLLEKSFK